MGVSYELELDLFELWQPNVRLYEVGRYMVSRPTSLLQLRQQKTASSGPADVFFIIANRSGH
ncbi:MAG: hypothetical protein J2P49_05400 [Methylocapsa sp.]|nr:hypothetical protein [Methylocapsa sp.]